MSETDLQILETERLALREITTSDAEFVLGLLNEPSFLLNIGDKGVRTIADAVQYIQTGPRASYKRFGFGLYLVELKDAGTPIGICGLLKRDSLPDVDIGFAFRPAFWLKGYASEAASAVMEYGRRKLGLRRMVAITAPHNQGSIKVLEKIGLKFERLIRLSEDEPEIRLFGTEPEPSST
jgi:RimJ/RimL family protein N-acetyltransferase